VYTTLAATVFLSTTGVYIHTLLNIGGIITSLLFILLSIWLIVIPPTIENEVIYLHLQHIILLNEKIISTTSHCNNA
jgi:hypothetical protein